MTSAPTALRCRTTPLAVETDLLELLGDPHGLVWLREGQGLVAWGEAARIEVGAGPDRFRRATDALRSLFEETLVEDEVELPGTGPLAFGALTFAADRPGSVLIVPEVVLGRRAGQGWLTTIGVTAPVIARAPSPPAHHRVRYEGSSLPELQWMAAVAKAARAVRDGALEKVVLARDRRVWSRTVFDARFLARRLSERFPTCWTFAVDGLVGASPELLIGRFGRSLSSRVLAGSAARGADAEQDRCLGEALLASEKDLAEHRPAVSRVADVLRGHAADLHVDPSPHLLRLANVQHLATELHGTVPDASPETTPSALELAGALHPTPAVCGSPTAAALELIVELESMDRARYAGPVGWVDANGDGEWCIALRCAELDGTRARLFAGAGIVGASLPEAELEETRLKLRAMQSAFDT